MKQLNYVFFLTLILFAGGLSAGPCLDGEVKLGGECRNAEWITLNLVADDYELLAYGDCISLSLAGATEVGTPTEARATCGIWVAEKIWGSSNRDIEAKIHLLSNTPCTGANCLGGYARLARLNLEVKVAWSNAETVTTSGTLKIAAANAGSASLPMGSISWWIDPSSYESEYYTPLGAKFGSDSDRRTDYDYLGEDRCDDTVAALVSNASVDNPIREIVSNGVDAIVAREVTIRGGGLGARDSFRSISNNIERAVSISIGASWAKKESMNLCKWLHGDLEKLDRTP